MLFGQRWILEGIHRMLSSTHHAQADKIKLAWSHYVVIFGQKEIKVI